MAPSLGVELTPIIGRDPVDIERDITVFARGRNGGLIVTGAGTQQIQRDTIVAAAAQHQLPAAYPFRGYVAEGGLISYGIDQAEPYRLAAGYVDRILKGEKPADLPVQTPTKYELAINLKTAKALGLEIPPTLARPGRRGDRVKRRDFITMLGGAAAAWPVASRAQQPAMPVIGFLRSTSSAPFQNLVVAFGQGLKEEGFVEGQNVVVDYRYADNQIDRLPALVADLIHRPVAVIVGDNISAIVAKACDDDGANRLRYRRRHGQERHRRQSQPARLQRHGHKLLLRGAGV